MKKINIKQYIQQVLRKYNFSIRPKDTTLFEEFVNRIENKNLVTNILENQEMLKKNWEIQLLVRDIVNNQFVMPNATVAKTYKTAFEPARQISNKIETWKLEGLEKIGFTLDKNTKLITGVPNQSGILEFYLLFKMKGQPEPSNFYKKKLKLFVNPDPRSLWKNKKSDNNALFWKKDNDKIFGSLGDKNIVVASKRGRSHANVGSFRDDDFAQKYIEKTGWSVVAVSDGAGSASLARKGAQLVCEATIDYFENVTSFFDKEAEFETKILQCFSQEKKSYYGQIIEDLGTTEMPNENLKTKKSEGQEKLLKEIEVLSKKELYKATLYAHNEIVKDAQDTKERHPHIFDRRKATSIVDYYHATLIYVLFKKYEFGYVILSFGVGDCPIAMMNKDKTETKLLNWLDVGEFGGGTRFVTQPQIFHSTKISSRFNFNIADDFSFLFLMTDGIYDPKFGVEANLEKNEKWLAFLRDLNGENESQASVIFDKTNETIADQLSEWMDFWSVGNHDDRTLAIIF